MVASRLVIPHERITRRTPPIPDPSFVVRNEVSDFITRIAHEPGTREPLEALSSFAQIPPRPVPLASSTLIATAVRRGNPSTSVSLKSPIPVLSAPSPASLPETDPTVGVNSHPRPTLSSYTESVKQDVAAAFSGHPMFGGIAEPLVTRSIIDPRATAFASRVSIGVTTTPTVDRPQGVDPDEWKEDPEVQRRKRDACRGTLRRLRSRLKGGSGKNFRPLISSTNTGI